MFNKNVIRFFDSCTVEEREKNEFNSRNYLIVMKRVKLKRFYMSDSTTVGQPTSE